MKVCWPPCTRWAERSELRWIQSVYFQSLIKMQKRSLLSKSHDSMNCCKCSEQSDYVCRHTWISVTNNKKTCLPLSRNKICTRCITELNKMYYRETSETNFSLVTCLVKWHSVYYFLRILTWICCLVFALSFFPSCRPPGEWLQQSWSF